MDWKEVYFIGIGGIGMSAIARYYHRKGLKVSGYDKTPSALTKELEEEGISVHYTDNSLYVPADRDHTLVVYTPAIPHDMGELVYVNATATPLSSVPPSLGKSPRDSAALPLPALMARLPHPPWPHISSPTAVRVAAPSLAVFPRTMAPTSL